MTVRVVDPATPPTAAVIVVVPAAIDVALPLEPAALLMVATAVFDDVQLADCVRSCGAAVRIGPRGGKLLYGSPGDGKD